MQHLFGPTSIPVGPVSFGANLGLTLSFVPTFGPDVGLLWALAAIPFQGAIGMLCGMINLYAPQRRQPS